MLKSMTGYGTAKGTVGGQSVTVEIRSLNSKFLELNLRLPSQFRDKELELRAELGRRIERGKADLSISFDNGDNNRKSTVNRELFNSYFNELHELSKEYHLSDVNMLDVILRMPQVLNNDKAESDENHWKELQLIIHQAINHFDEFRKNEGGVLETDILNRLRAIEARIPEVEVYEPQRIEAIRARMQKGFNDIKDTSGADLNRFEQELIYYIEKLDISEEKVRLRSHCDYFLQTINSPEANGKKLGFITQELGREINTMGSKANDARIQRLVVEMKDELEKLKEQLANVL
jgi:uncharacterized protein (TIGR00255 family)